MHNVTDAQLRVMFNALVGISACATACPCCMMLADIAREAIAPFKQDLFTQPKEPTCD